MANILLVTSIYTCPDFKLYGSTDVCHFFAKEWIKLGHNVKVVYNYTIYTPFLHFISKYFSHQIGSRFPAVINCKRITKPFIYNVEGIDVFLNPIYKVLPRTSFRNDELAKNASRTINWIDRLGFNPDIIIGHFMNPQIDTIPLIQHQKQAKSVLVFHGKLREQDEYLVLSKIGNFDIIGFRSYPILKSFNNIKEIKSKFLCPSGIPEDFIDVNSWRKHEEGYCNSILYVGNLIKRKFPLSVAKAVHRLNDSKIILSIIGSGDESKNIRSYIEHNNIDNVKLEGRKPRLEVVEKMKDSHIFVMISKDETFGLVYLEAMAKGCIVIASREEGMDGIIQDGENGFLCHAGNEEELIGILKKIKNLSSEERVQISKNALATVKDYTDKEVAAKYLSNIL